MTVVGAALAPMRNRIAAAVAFAFTFLCLFVLASSSPASNRDGPQPICSRTCVSENCDTFGIRYGKYCGVAWTGCPGEKPCDEVDACCKVHDDCVGKKGMTNVKCHQKFKTCVKKVQKSGKVGFSKVCPYEKAIPTMMKGMDMAIVLSQLDGKSAGNCMDPSSPQVLVLLMKFAE